MGGRRDTSQFFYQAVGRLASMASLLGAIDELRKGRQAAARRRRRRARRAAGGCSGWRRRAPASSTWQACRRPRSRRAPPRVVADGGGRRHGRRRRRRRRRRRGRRRQPRVVVHRVEGGRRARGCSACASTASERPSASRRDGGARPTAPSNASRRPTQARSARRTAAWRRRPGGPLSNFMSPTKSRESARRVIARANVTKYTDSTRHRRISLLTGSLPLLALIDPK